MEDISGLELIFAEQHYSIFVSQMFDVKNCYRQYNQKNISCKNI